MTLDHEDRWPPLPACVIEYVRAVVRGIDYSPRIASQVRRELLSHFEDALEGLNEPVRAEHAERLVTQFGDTKILAALIRRAKKRCRKEEIMNISGVFGIGLLLFFAWSVLKYPYYDYRAALFDPPILFLCVGVAVALNVISFGMRNFLQGVWALRVLIVKCSRKDFSSGESSVIRGLISHVYSAAVMLLLVGAVVTLRYAGTTWSFSTSVSLLSPLYAVVIAEGILRPAVRRIEGLVADAPASGLELEVRAEPKVTTAD